MGLVYLRWKKVVDQCWHLRELASWERVVHQGLGGGAMVGHQVLGHGTTFQYEWGSYVLRVHCGRCGVEKGEGGGLEAYHIVVDPCMDLLEIRRLQ